MNGLERQLAEDKALRDAARGLFSADLAVVRADLAARGVGARIADRLGESTLDMVDEAVDYAAENRGAVTAGLAAIVLWFARGPILDALGALLGDDETDDDALDEAEPRQPDDRSERD